MKILVLGDVVGKSGREILETHLPKLKVQHQIDCVVVNGENAAHGFGITKSICEEFYKCGVDVITLGNHAWDQKDILTYINNDPRLIRPINFSVYQPGKGYTLVQTKSGKKVLVINAMGQLFMPQCDDPFHAVDTLLKTYTLGKNVDAIIVDMHAEATSEKMAMGFSCDGRVSLVVGSHTHVPTADHQILPNGTGYMTDLGMCGDYLSVLGMDKEVPVLRFQKKVCLERLKPAQGPGTLSGVYAEIDEETGLCQKIKPLRIGARLENSSLD